MPKKLPAIFTDEAAARSHLEAIQWPDGPVCPFCGVIDRASRITTRHGLWFCNACRKQFTVMVGTVFERSRVPLNTWLYANFLICSSKKGISSQQLARMLGVTVKTAWFMSHRIRLAMAPSDDASPLGGSGQIVESDETELSPSRKTRPRPRGKNLKFVTLVERDGRARSRKLTGKGMPIGSQVHAMLDDNVHPKSILHTDGATFYKSAWPWKQRESVDHNKEFVRISEAQRAVHTNTAEGFFSIFKRGLVGTYQHMSEQHLARYLAEFDFRMNYRIRLGYTDDMRADIALKGIAGKRLTYRRIGEAPHA